MGALFLGSAILVPFVAFAPQSTRSSRTLMRIQILLDTKLPSTSRACIVHGAVPGAPSSAPRAHAEQVLQRGVAGGHKVLHGCVGGVVEVPVPNPAGDEEDVEGGCVGEGVRCHDGHGLARIHGAREVGVGRRGEETRGPDGGDGARGLPEERDCHVLLARGLRDREKLGLDWWSAGTRRGGDNALRQKHPRGQ